MLKFHSEADKQLFLFEAGGDTPTHHSNFFKRRQLTGTLFKNFHKSQSQKRNWNRHKFKIMQAIKGFHHSTDGQRFHRQLNRFNLTHINIPKQGLFLARECAELKECFKTYIKNELGYYHSFSEQMDLEMILEYLI